MKIWPFSGTTASHTCFLVNQFWPSVPIAVILAPAGRPAPLKVTAEPAAALSLKVATGLTWNFALALVSLAVTVISYSPAGKSRRVTDPVALPFSSTVASLSSGISLSPNLTLTFSPLGNPSAENLTEISPFLLHRPSVALTEADAEAEALVFG